MGMTNAEAISLLKQALAEIEWTQPMQYAAAIDKAIEVLEGKDKDVPTKWISVKDRLPEIDEDVLILYESKVSRKTGYAITFLKDSFYFGSTPIPYETPQWNEPWQYFRENNSITHWMPLPSTEGLNDAT